MLNISRKPMPPQEDLNRHLNSLETLRTPRAARALAYWLLGIVVLVLVVLFLPWQQNIRGVGTITAFSQNNRPQQVETAIPGRIARWHVREGQPVAKGDTILSLTEIKEKFFDPLLLTRLEEQINAKQEGLQAKEDKARALTAQIAALRQARDFKQQQIANKLVQASLKVESDSLDVLAANTANANAENQYLRVQNLYNQGLKALTDLQDKETKYRQTQAKQLSAANKLAISRNERLNIKIDLSAVLAEYADKISKAQSTLSQTRAELYDSQASLAKLRNEYANMEIRSQQYHILAPQDGYVVQALKSGIGETIKEGEAVATIMPQTPDLAVALYVNPMDAVLLQKGRRARLEFDGWPAVQFSGWPGASVGTFGGVIQVVDYVNSPNGKYRILITPDPVEEPWPEALRMGSGANGWVMLDNVTVGFELWRQLNGFPPNLVNGNNGDSQAKDKK